MYAYKFDTPKGVKDKGEKANVCERESALQ